MWLRRLRQLSHEVQEALHDMCTEEIRDTERERRRYAIASFWDGGGIRRLLRQQAPTLHSPLIESEIPDTLVVSGPQSSLERLAAGLRELVHAAPISRLDDRITISGITPAKWHSVLTLLVGTDLVIQDLGGRGQVVSSVEDRLSSWEYSLASAASATKAFCPKCLSHDCFFPACAEREGARSIITWCLRCKQVVEPAVDPSAYDHLSFLPAQSVVPSVPVESWETLRGPIADDDADYFLGQLPNRRAAPGIPYEC
jgi:hypothetical protein